MALHFTTFVALFFLLVIGNAEDDARFDCYPERLSLGPKAVNKTLCEARGCIWKEPVTDQVRRRFSHRFSIVSKWE